MRTLAARFMMDGGAVRVARVAAIAAPMVLVECGGVAKNDARPPAPTVVVDVPAPPARTTEDGSSQNAKPKRHAPAPQASTVLNANLYPGCVAEARLSVIRPDNTLERVILDPKVDFALSQHAGASYTLICEGVPECKVDRVVKSPNPTSDIVMIHVAFTPGSGSRLNPARAILVITQDEARAYCP